MRGFWCSSRCSSRLGPRVRGNDWLGMRVVDGTRCEGRFACSGVFIGSLRWGGIVSAGVSAGVSGIVLRGGRHSFGGTFRREWCEPAAPVPRSSFAATYGE